MIAKLLVSNLDKSTTEDELDLLFSRYGEVESISINENPDPGKRTFSALVVINDEEDAEEIMDQLQGQKLNSRPLHIKWFEDEDWEDEWEGEDETYLEDNFA